MSKLRFDVVQDAFKKKAVPAESPAERTSKYFGELVFDREKMHKYLSTETYEALIDCIDNGHQLDRAIADEVADGMKTWAMEHGVTHITHWFQPLTEGTAEKHDSLMEYDGKGGMLEEFTGKSLIQQEPDASSFPSGGIRATFEARGYTAWDPTSPVFIQDDTLCIPTVFISYTGEALDYKTPLKKSLKAVSDAAVPICQMFDPKVKKVYSYLGWEQEYFLVDEDLFAARPDLMLTGRTLMGHESSKNQQLDDHYFGAIPSRVMEFMKDVEIAGYRHGIPLKTRHNEVAPNQFELAPIFGETNLSNDQNQMMMNLMQQIARKVLVAVQKHNALLKASIATATNAHRLGANEAPPAIISSFLGHTMTQVLHKLLEVPSDTPIEIAGKKEKSVGLVEIPEIFIDNTDRNRTSPFAFTGNRFEFRAVGSSANCAGAMTTLNAAVAEQLTAFKAAVDKEIAAGKPMNIAFMDVLKPLIASIINTVCFDGNGYTDEWKEEAKRRGLDTEISVPLMFDQFTKPASIEMFTNTGVYTEAELKARNEVKWETYTKKVQIEARVMGRMAQNHIIPAALAYKTRLLTIVTQLKALYPEDYETMAQTELALLQRVTKLIEEVRTKCAAMVDARKAANKIEDEREKALAYHEIAESLFAIRRPIDKLEEVVDNDLWPLPKYRELLFIN